MHPDKIKKSAYLIQCALRRPPARPTEAAYRDAIDAFNVDPDIRTCTSAIAEGLGLKILDVNEYGIFLASDGASSAFKPRLEQINRTFTRAESRQVFGLVLTTIAALFFQTATQLDDDDSAPTISVHEVREALTDLVGARTEQLSSEEEQDSSDIDEACAAINNLTATAPTPGGKARPGTLHRYIEQAFSFLEDEHFVKRRGDESGGVYTAFRKFRIHMKTFAATEAHHTVCEILDRQQKQQEAAHA